MSTPRILFCCHVPVDPKLGAAKYYLQLLEGLKQLGWDAQIAGPKDIGIEGLSPTSRPAKEKLRDFIQQASDSFDVIEVDHTMLPFPRTDFPKLPALSARATGLAHLYAKARIPSRPDWRYRVKFFVKAPVRWRYWRNLIKDADLTIGNADVVFLHTRAEYDELAQQGHDTEKLAVFHAGLPNDIKCLYDFDPGVIPPGPPRIAFIGTFDPRKGMCDFPRIVAGVLKKVPQAQFVLLGTDGMVRGKEAVLLHFPERHRSAVEVHPSYRPAELPRLLAQCSVGVFPSLVEGFPFAVLEMSAAGLPVVCYDVPGPDEMLPPDLRVPVRDTTSLCEKIVSLLTNDEKLKSARVEARQRSEGLVWADIVRQIGERYQQVVATHRVPQTNAVAGL